MPIETGPSLDIRSEDGRHALRLSLLNDGKVIGGIQLSAEQVDDLIGGLATIRSQMDPAVPGEFIEGKPIHHTGDTLYQVGIEPFLDRAILSFRNPGLGWLSFEIAEEVLHKILDQIATAKMRLTPAAGHMKQ